MKISYEQAGILEAIMRNVYKCGRSGVMGLANANFLMDSPLSAIVAVLAPLSFQHSTEELPEVDTFWGKYRYKLVHDEFDSHLIDQCITDLEKIVDKYY